MDIISRNLLLSSQDSGVVTSGMFLYVDAGLPSSYPGAGTTWTDISGQNNNGSFVGSIGYSSSNGGYLSFNGDGSYVDFGASSVFNQSNGKSFTVTCWAYFDFLGAVHNPIFNKASVNGSWEYTLGISNGGGVNWLTSNAGNNWVNPGVSGVTISTGNWYFFCVGYDYNSQVAFALVNGQSSFTTVSQSGIFNGTRPLQVGRHNDPGTGLSGRVAAINMYNRAFSPSEANQNFNALRGRFGL